MKVFRIVCAIISTLLGVFILTGRDTTGALPYLVFAILASFEIFGTKNHKSIYLILKIIILIVTGLMFLINLSFPQSSSVIDTLVWLIFFLAFILGPSPKSFAEKKDVKINKKRSHLFVWLNSHRLLWLVSWLTSLLIFITSLVLVALKVSFLNGLAISLLLDISSLVFLITLAIWSLVKFGKSAVIPVIFLLLVLLGESYSIGSDIYKHQFSYNPKPTPLPTLAPITSENWKEYISPDGKFKFSCPDNFNYSKSVVTSGNPGINYMCLSSQADPNGTAIVVLNIYVGIYPNDVDVSAMVGMPNYLDLISPLNSTASGKIISHGSCVLGNYKCFTYKADVDGRYWVDKHIAVGQTLYILEANYSDLIGFDEINANKFINSFTIMNK